MPLGVETPGRPPRIPPSLGELPKLPPPAPGAWPRSDDPVPGAGPRSEPAAPGRAGTLVSTVGACAAARLANAPTTTANKSPRQPARLRADRPARANLAVHVGLNQPWIGFHRPRLVSIGHFTRFLASADNRSQRKSANQSCRLKSRHEWRIRQADSNRHNRNNQKSTSRKCRPDPPNSLRAVETCGDFADCNG